MRIVEEEKDREWQVRMEKVANIATTSRNLLVSLLLRFAFPATLHALSPCAGPPTVSRPSFLFRFCIHEILSRLPPLLSFVSASLSFYFGRQPLPLVLCSSHSLAESIYPHFTHRLFSFESFFHLESLSHSQPYRTTGALTT